MDRMPILFGAPGCAGPTEFWVFRSICLDLSKCGGPVPVNTAVIPDSEFQDRRETGSRASEAKFWTKDGDIVHK
jgi:hypothetical protein